MYIENTTAEERYTVERITGVLMGRLDRANTILSYAWGEHFSKINAQLDRWTTEVVGNLLYMATDEIYNILLEYHLTVGDLDFRGVEPHMAGFEKVQARIRTDKLIERSRKSDHSLPEENRLCMTLPDAQAAKALEALLGAGH